MLNIFKQLKENLFNKPKQEAESASLSEAPETLSHPGIIGLTAIWDVYDMWI